MALKWLALACCGCLLVLVGTGRARDDGRRGRLVVTHLSRHQVDALATDGRGGGLDPSPLDRLPTRARATANGGRDHLSMITALAGDAGIDVIALRGSDQLLVVPSDRCPRAALRALQAAAAPEPLGDMTQWPTLERRLPEDRRAAYRAALDRLLPGRSERALPLPYGKLVAHRCAIGGLERFMLVLLPGGRVALVGHTGLVRYEGDETPALRADAGRLDTQASWQLARHSHATVTLMSHAGTYLRWGHGRHFALDAGAKRVEERSDPSQNHEQFVLWSNPDGTYSLKLPNNKVSVGVTAWDYRPGGYSDNCHFYGYQKNPNGNQIRSIWLGESP